MKININLEDYMNVLEVFGLAFIVLVIINVTSMIWAVKHARINETLNITKAQEF